MVLTIDEVNDCLDEMAEGFPEALFRELNGGVCLLEEAVPDPDFPPGEMYILGEDWDRETWEAELRTTLSHELTHHMEGLGGLHALDDRDAAELAQWRQELNAADEK